MHLEQHVKKLEKYFKTSDLSPFYGTVNVLILFG